MKVSDYIVSFLVEQGISDVFGYPGGMVIHIMDSFSKYKDMINAHLTYHEQGAAFAACGYAQTSLKPGVAYATSGPGATNLITGICNAYYDSIPVLFITGQVNTYEGKGSLPIRQKGFQEMDVVSLVSSITKYSARITSAKDIRFHLEKAISCAVSGRQGPVLLDIPMDIQRSDIAPEELESFTCRPVHKNHDIGDACRKIDDALRNSKRPCILVGAGVMSSGMGEYLNKWVSKIKVPVVSSMLAVDAIPKSKYNYGFIGAYGLRHSNFIVAKSDLIISFGSRLDLRQVGINVDGFAPNAHLIRTDIDETEFSRKIKSDEDDIHIDLKDILPALKKRDYEPEIDFSPWRIVCDEIKSKLEFEDEQYANKVIRAISGLIGEDYVITTDVGQNQVWVAQSFACKGQRVLFSGGHGSMGYSLPAAIGAYYGSGKKVVSFNGDGGFQMNIQELQFIAREQLPIKIILLNNSSLGMIRHFQEMYLDSNYMQTKRHTGYLTPDFCSIVSSYGIPCCKVRNMDELSSIEHYLSNDAPAFIELILPEDTYVFPKLSMGRLNQDQDPLLDRDLFDYITEL